MVRHLTKGENIITNFKKEEIGKNGEGYFRLTSFNTPEKTQEAMNRLKELLM